MRPATRDILKLASKHRDTFPEMPGTADDDLLGYLEATFPPRCYEPGFETLEEHLRYAGKVELVQQMREAASRPSEDYEPPVPLTGETVEL